MDKIQEIELEVAEAAVNRATVQQVMGEWEGNIMEQCTELGVYLVHLYAQVVSRGMPPEEARRFCIYFIDTYIRWHGGQTWFLEMPDITSILGAEEVIIS
jgi:hypothetical protein